MCVAEACLAVCEPPLCRLTCAHKANALGAVLASHGGILWRVCICPHANLAEGIHPLHEHRQGACTMTRLWVWVRRRSGGGQEMPERLKICKCCKSCTAQSARSSWMLERLPFPPCKACSTGEAALHVPAVTQASAATQAPAATQALAAPGTSRPLTAHLRRLNGLPAQQHLPRCAVDRDIVTLVD